MMTSLMFSFVAPMPSDTPSTTICGVKSPFLPNLVTYCFWRESHCVEAKVSFHPDDGFQYVTLYVRSRRLALLVASWTPGRAGGQDLQPWDWKSSTTERGMMSTKQACVCWWPRSRDIMRAKGTFFFLHRFTMEAIMDYMGTLGVVWTLSAGMDRRTQRMQTCLFGAEGERG